jgi:hypothetical protein
MVHSIDIRVDKRGLKLQTQSPGLGFAFYLALWGLDECLEVVLSMTEDMHVRKQAWLAALVGGEKKTFLKADSSTSLHLSIWHSWREAEVDWWRILSSSRRSAFEWKYDQDFISKMSSNLEKLAVGMTLQPLRIIEFMQLQWRRVVREAGARYDQSMDQAVASVNALQGPRTKSRLDLHPESAGCVSCEKRELMCSDLALCYLLKASKRSILAEDLMPVFSCVWPAEVVGRIGSNITLHEGFRSHVPPVVAKNLLLVLQTGGPLVRSQDSIASAASNGLMMPRFGKKLPRSSRLHDIEAVCDYAYTPYNNQP